MRHSWQSNLIKSWEVMIESSQVIALRTIKIASGGPAAESEIRLMIEEKITAAAQLHKRALHGSLSQTHAVAVAQSLDHYGKKVAANRRRLSKR